MIKAEQARAYEAMKGQFEGLLGRLQASCVMSRGGRAVCSPPLTGTQTDTYVPSGPRACLARGCVRATSSPAGLLA